MSKQTTPQCLVTAHKKIDGYEKSVTISIQALLQKAGIWADPDAVVFSVRQNGCALECIMEPEETGYPFIHVLGSVPDTEFDLGRFELPNRDYPEQISARLYAGKEEDEPIALCLHGIDPDAEEKEKASVYIDYDRAKAVPWEV